MPETIEDYYARVLAAADEEGRLGIPTDGIPYWEIFPFEAEGLRLKPIEPLARSEEPRHGEDPTQCHCARRGDVGESSSVDGEVWRDEHWRISVTEPSGAPLILMLSPQAHHDFTTLPMDRAAEMGQIMVALGAAMEALPSVARVHVSKWGDGGAHAHIFFYARPTRMPQLRGTMMAVWDDFLPFRVTSATRTLEPPYRIWSEPTADVPLGAQPDQAVIPPAPLLRSGRFPRRFQPLGAV